MRKSYVELVLDPALPSRPKYLQAHMQYDDPASLATAIVRLLQEPALVQQLRATRPSEVYTSYASKRMAPLLEQWYTAICAHRSF
jgi:hypothetical protein